MVSTYRHAYAKKGLVRHIVAVRSIYSETNRPSHFEIFLTPDDALALAGAVREHPHDLTVRDAAHPEWHIRITGWRMEWHQEDAIGIDCLWESGWPEYFAAELERAVFPRGCAASGREEK